MSLISAASLSESAKITGADRRTRTTPLSLRPNGFCQAGPAELGNLKLGLKRHISIYGAAEAAQNGDLDLDALREIPSCYAVVRKLESLNGVAGKIADCVALFSLDKLEAFPLDRHIRKGMREMYFPGNLTAGRWRNAAKGA